MSKIFVEAVSSQLLNIYVYNFTFLITGKKPHCTVKKNYADFWNLVVSIIANKRL